MDDAALVDAARRGDREAWGLIYDRYADKLHDHCWSILRDEHEAGDALQDAFVKAAGAIGQLRDPSRLRPWLYAIARNEAYRRHRARSRVVPTEGLGVDDDGEFGTVTVDLDREAGSPVEDLRRLVWDAAGGLSADDQALLDLHLRQGLEGEELAEAMGITPNNAYVKLSRLRDTLERSLGALLVARTGSRDCEELAAIVAGWDGTMSPLLRKRVARHVDGCETCGDRKRAMVSPLALLAGVPLLPAPAALRDRILDAATTAAASAPQGPAAPSAPAGPTAPPPAATPDRGGSPWGWVAGGAAALLVVVIALLLALGGGDDPEEVVSDQPSTTEDASTTTSSTSSTTSSTSSTTTSSTTSTTLPVALPGAIGITAGDIDLGTTARQGVFRLENTGGSPLDYVLTTTNALLRATPATGRIAPGDRVTITVRFDRPNAPEGPFQHGVHVDAGTAGTADAVVRGSVPPEAPEISDVSADKPDMQTTCNAANSTTEITATFSDASAVTAVLSWTSTTNGDGDTPMEVVGNRATATLGPFDTADLALSYTVTITDAFGAATTSSPQTIEVLPCPN